MLSGEVGVRCGGGGGGVLALAQLYPPPRTEFLPPPPRPYARYPLRAPALPTAPGYARPPPHAAFPLYRAPPPRPRAGFVPPSPRSPPAPAPSPPPARFARGALIRLESGQLRRVEDMRTEDFVSSAEHCADVALLHCTLLRLEERGGGGALSLTLACRPAAPSAADQHRPSRDQVEMESTVEHPFFVYGQGWASAAPERTLQRYGLSVRRLRVGDVCVSLAARAPPQPENLSLREERKRRWSAPDPHAPFNKR